MLASCDNCVNRREGACALMLKPKAGDVLCTSYAMTATFQSKVLDLARLGIEREVNTVLLRFRVEQVDAFAG